jgi:hypothetical protein
MANRYVRSTGGNWSVAGTWESTSGLKDTVAVPTAADDVYLDSQSGNLSINAAAACRSFDALNYAGTISHGAFALTIGTTSARGDNVALRLPANYSAPAATSAITFSSTSGVVLTIDYNNETVGNQTFSAGDYQMQNSWTMVTTATYVSLTGGTLDFNNCTMNGGRFATSGATARTLTLGSSILYLSNTGSTATFSYAGSNFTISPNSAKIFFTGASPLLTGNGVDFNGASIYVVGAAGTFSITGDNTFYDVYVAPTTTKSLTFPANGTQTILGELYIQPTGGIITIASSVAGTSSTISKSFGTVIMYMITIRDITFTGGTTAYARNNCTNTSNNNGITFDAGTWCLDYVNGSDAVVCPFGWWKVTYTSVTGTAPAIDSTVTGANGTAKVMYISLGEWAYGTGTMFFYGKTGTFASETVTTTSGSFVITADLTTGAWKTITSGALAARIGPGDIIQIAKSADPSGKGSGTWTNGSKTVTLVALTNCTFTDSGNIKVRATSVDHNLTTGDIVTVSATESGTYDGTYAITVITSSTFDLDGTTYSADKTGTVTPAFTTTVDLCETAWTAGSSGDMAAGIARTAVATDGKEGSYCMKFTPDATPQASVLQAYYNTGTLNLSLYQKLSFWFKNEVAVSTATTWKLVLYDDVDAGGSALATFPIPICLSLTSWMPLTIAPTEGGNLPASVKSIGLLSGVTIPTASKYIYLDNILACTTSGLNLQSLISKNSSASGGNEPWIGIQSIVGNTVLLDNAPATKGNAGRGYSTLGNAVETVPTYIRETTQTVNVAATTVVHTLLDNGVYGLNIKYQGGYNSATNSIDGLTFFDGLAGTGYGIAGTTRSFVTLDRLNMIRYNYGVYIYTTNSNFLLDNIYNLNNNAGYGLYSDTTYNSIYNNIVNCSYNGAAGIYLSTFHNNVLNQIVSASSNITSGITLIGGRENIFKSATCLNNATYGIQGGINCSGNIIKNLITANNVTNSVYNTQGDLYLENAIVPEAMTSAVTLYDDSRILSQKHQGDANDHWIYTDGATIDTQHGAGTRHTESGLAWRFTISSSTRHLGYPVKLTLAKILCTANNWVTVKVFIKKDSATTIGVRLVVPGSQISGVPDDLYQAKADDTDWQELTQQFLPTETGVIEVEAWVYYISGNSYAYVDDLSVSQV